jgi:hypothetical protein
MTSLAEVQATRWRELTAAVNKWFSTPDLEGLRIILSAVSSHYKPEVEPVWLFVVGPSSSAKTKLGIEPLQALPQAHVVGSLTPKTFLSSYGGKHDSGLLSRLGAKPLLLFKDFTTFLSLRPDDRTTVSSHLREMYDGFFQRDTGAGKTLSWRGKATVIAACTPAIERAWAVHRDLGERFISVRWRSGPRMAAAGRAVGQRAKQAEIREELQKLTQAFLSTGIPKPEASLPQPANDTISRLSCMVGYLRAHVIRDSYHRDIIDTVEAEGPGRLVQILDSLCRAHAALFGRETVSNADLGLAHRVALDSVPVQRLKVYQAISRKGPLGYVDLGIQTALNNSSLTYHLDELVAVDVLTKEQEGNKAIYEFSDIFKEFLPR